jgi:hypothetical protein
MKAAAEPKSLNSSSCRDRKRFSPEGGADGIDAPVLVHLDVKEQTPVEEVRTGCANRHVRRLALIYFKFLRALSCMYRNYRSTSIFFVACPEQTKGPQCAPPFFIYAWQGKTAITESGSGVQRSAKAFTITTGGSDLKDSFRRTKKINFFQLTAECCCSIPDDRNLRNEELHETPDRYHHLLYRRP